MSAQLHQLLRGIVIFRQTKTVTDAEIQIVEAVAMSTIPSLRMSVIRSIDPASGASADDIGIETKIPRSVLYRVLDDMKMLELLEWRHQERPRDSRRGKYYATKEYAGFFKQAQAQGAEGGPR